jgi:hypothetical protein
LSSGHDVVVPQYLGRLDFIVQPQRLAAERNAPSAEIMLTDTKNTALSRFAARADDPALAEHHRPARRPPRPHSTAG